MSSDFDAVFREALDALEKEWRATQSEERRRIALLDVERMAANLRHERTLTEAMLWAFDRWGGRAALPFAIHLPGDPFDERIVREAARPLRLLIPEIDARYDAISRRIVVARHAGEAFQIASGARPVKRSVEIDALGRLVRLAERSGEP